MSEILDALRSISPVLDQFRRGDKNTCRGLLTASLPPRSDKKFQTAVPGRNLPKSEILSLMNSE